MQATNALPAAAAAAAAVATPEDGREYRVVLGRSLVGGAHQHQQLQATTAIAVAHAPSESASVDEVFVSFRYEFQPASVDTRTPGLVTVDESNGLQVLRGHSSGAPGGILFRGKMVENKEIDCLLLFDGENFRLEKCPFAFTQLRHVRAPAAAVVAANPSSRSRQAGKRPALTPSDAAAVSTAGVDAVAAADVEERNLQRLR
ncbi:hypothetical protein PybrP1_008626 [[Pythium] brassicae (nom. inval.)]|nr:hypothetical protein PybrP1_008626 [[Pythium] brassicae (nom. inval.)]